MDSAWLSLWRVRNQMIMGCSPMVSLNTNSDIAPPFLQDRDTCGCRNQCSNWLNSQWQGVGAAASATQKLLPLLALQTRKEFYLRAAEVYIYISSSCRSWQSSEQYPENSSDLLPLAAYTFLQLLSHLPSSFPIITLPCPLTLICLFRALYGFAVIGMKGMNTGFACSLSLQRGTIVSFYALLVLFHAFTKLFSKPPWLRLSRPPLDVEPLVRTIVEKKARWP